MRRREFITLVGGTAVAWPLAARAQQQLPVIGFLNSQSPDGYTSYLRAFRQGLKETGYVERENVTIEYRWAENQMDRLPALAADLVRREVAVIIATGGTPPTLAAKAATQTIPIVFAIADNPVKYGLVASLNRPDGNATGVNIVNAELTTKRLELLRELVPSAARMAVLVNPSNQTTTEITLREVQEAARHLGLQIQVFNASTSHEIDAAFSSFAREGIDAVFVGPDIFFVGRRTQFITLAARHAVPATFPSRDFPEGGGLMSYGADIANAWHQVGVYAGHILKGAKPIDLPVVQASKFELVINAQTARMLGLTVPDKLLVLADEVIE